MSVHMLEAIVKRLGIIAVSIAVCTVGVATLLWSVSEISDRLHARTPVDQIFEYQSVEFAGFTDDGDLSMLSVSEWHVDVDRIVWVDQLRCDEGGIYSTQATEGRAKKAAPLGVAPWVYSGAVPMFSDCFIRATITATVRGNDFTQQIDSGTFSTRRPAGG